MKREEAIALMQRASSFRTICEVHREMFDLYGSIPEPLQTRLRDLLLEAFVMAKKMDKRLREYKVDWDNGFYEVNQDHRSDSKRRKAA